MKRSEYSLKEHACMHVLRERGGDYILSREAQKVTDVVIHGDAVQVLRALPEHSVQAIITSPPYYKQRDYNTKDQLGNEQTAEEYVRKLVSVFAECKRVLRPDGLFWLNIGDKYLGGRLLGMPWRERI